MTDVLWNKVYVECVDHQKLRESAELCHKKRVGILLLPNNHVENGMVGRSLMKAQYKIITPIINPGQKRPGIDKMRGVDTDIFDADGFELHPMNTIDPIILYNDLKQCSDFLISNMSQPLIIGWNLSSMQLKNEEKIKFMNQIPKAVRPAYLRFSEAQTLECSIAKSTCATKTLLPFGVDSESDFKVINCLDALKIAAQPV